MYNFSDSGSEAVLNTLKKRRNVYTIIFVVCLIVGGVCGVIPVVKSYGSFMQGFTGKDGRIDIKQRKNVTNYVVVKYGRDTEMPNYERIRELNEDFENKLNISEPKKPTKRTAITVIGVLIILVSIILALVESNSAEIWEICVCVIFPLVMIPVTVSGWLSYKKKLNYYNLIQQQLNCIYEEALTLV